ncbi:hypothetical protein Mal4_19590 [Maioricimonas rarisocia]|uniref:Uncharacterized protein n=1 Tax=Maioricimonas rarisocia TaxID=2528026 RepID=A0A517Z5A6_9PLAN|nr:hypothetical protein [Maioricimonas rarisocia]QDU37644.1 hypothetical protein Mal4_19590 [Maioricimonas rarisocia]
MRPRDIDSLEPVLEEIVTHGAAMAPKSWHQWLVATGVALPTPRAGWLSATQCFLQDATPAPEPIDLVRCAAIRDPRYRLYLDVTLLSVMHTVGTTDRWQRLEDLLFGRCRALAPRLMQLVDSEVRRHRRKLREVRATDWGSTLNAIVDSTGGSFRSWDKHLWGDCRGPAELFPLLLDLYATQNEQPIHVDAEASEVSDGAVLLACLIEAAQNGDGVEIRTENSNTLQQLQDNGVPVRVWKVGANGSAAALVGRVTLVADQNAEVLQRTEAPTGVPAVAKLSRQLPRTHLPITRQLSAAVLENKPTVGVFSLAADSNVWPEIPDNRYSEWMALPARESLRGTRRGDEDPETTAEALHQLADHPVYGLMLQLMILESLDRELGEVTLILSPPVNRKLISLSVWGESRVLYRPSAAARSDTETLTAGFLLLGEIDGVLDTVASEIGVTGIASVRQPAQHNWARVLALLSSAGVIVGRHDRWALADDVLDRLHAGALMKQVVRQGRDIRNELHRALNGLWQKASKRNVREEVPV